MDEQSKSQYGQTSQENQQMPQNVQALQENQQMPQYGQPQYSQPQYSQPGQSWQQPGQPQNVQSPQWNDQMPQYGQPQYGQLGQLWQQPGQPQNIQSPQWSQQMPQYGQPQYSQLGQPWQQPYDTPMGYMGYENRQDTRTDVKKGSTHIPNILNIVGIIMALVSVFLPYAHIGSDVRTVSGVFGITVLSFIIVPIVILADVICAFIDKAVCYIVDLIISIAVGGALILEFVLALIDLKKMDPWEEIGLSFGSWFSVAAALLLLASVPVWWIISRKKKNADASEQN